MECVFSTCERDAHAAGMCHGHYQQKRAGKELRPLRPLRVLPQDQNGRVCTKCDEYKPWSEFYKPSSVWPRSVCIRCMRQADKDRRTSLKESE